MTITGSATPKRWLGYGLALLGVLLGSAIASPLKEVLDLTNIALFYVLLVVLAGANFGRGPAIFCAILGSSVFAFIFVPPNFSWAITEGQDTLTAVIMLIVALLVGHLTATLRSYAQTVEERAAQSSALYELARDLAGKQTSAEVEASTLKFLGNTFHANVPALLPREQFDLTANSNNVALIQSNAHPYHLISGPTDRDGNSLVSLPLVASAGPQGILRFTVATDRLASLRFRELAETVASLVAIALERTHFAEIARENELEKTAQNLRCSILASLSHDIRTPLTSLVGTADTLMMGYNLEPEKQKSLLSSLREQALSIHQLVINLLEMTRLQTGNIELNQAWQPIEEVLGATLKQASDITRHRQITLEIQAGLPPLRIDAVLIERVLWNLIENACKYSPETSPIEITATRQDAYIDVAVFDRGPGLPLGMEESIFRLFQRGKTESNIPGAGLGLAIARSITEAHHGQLLAQNREGGGSCFHLLLPIGTPPYPPLED